MQNKDNYSDNSVNINNPDCNLSIDPATTHYNSNYFIKNRDIQNPSSNDIDRERKNSPSGN